MNLKGVDSIVTGEAWPYQFEFSTNTTSGPSSSSFFGTRIATCVTLVELQMALISYQDCHTLP